MDIICVKCKNKISWLLIITSLFFSLIKGFIGIFGSSESLVADGLFSFYQSFIAVKLLWPEREKQNILLNKSSLWLSGLLVTVILFLGSLDVFVFSIIRIWKGSQGFLVRPSPYALYAAILSVLAAQILYRYNFCGGNRKPDTTAVHDGAGLRKNDGSAYKAEIEITENLKLSMIVSTIVIIGICFARFKSLYGDPIAALIAILILDVKFVPMAKESVTGLIECMSGLKDQKREDVPLPEIK